MNFRFRVYTRVRLSLFGDIKTGVYKLHFSRFSGQGVKGKIDKTCHASADSGGVPEYSFHFKIILKTLELILLYTFARQRDAQ